MNTLHLTKAQSNRLDHVAQQLGETPEALLQRHLDSLVEELLEELEDIAQAREQSRAYRAGEIKGKRLEDLELELLAMEDEEVVE